MITYLKERPHSWEMSMNAQRKFEIAYLLLKQQLKEDGLALNSRFKRRLDNATKTLGIPKEEIEEFAALIARDVYGSTDAAPI